MITLLLLFVFLREVDLWLVEEPADLTGEALQKESGQAVEVLTAGKQWQLRNIMFIKAHIAPRTYTS